MAIRINFDSSNKLIMPTFVLTTRNGSKIGYLPATDVVFKNGMSESQEITFVVKKDNCKSYVRNGFTINIWNEIKNFKLLWVKDWNRFYEITVEIDDSDGMSKRITAKELGVSELSQTRVYGLEINTEEDILRDDYSPSVLYNPENIGASIVNRIIYKAPHYSIGYVDSSISSIQRTFSFDNVSILDAFSAVAEEIDCYIVYDCYLNADGYIERKINIYDLEDYCLDCKHRGSYVDKCDECGSHDIKYGYGSDTTIFIDKNNLANDILFTTDTGSVKNVFRLEAGDELMTATIANCNPGGAGEIYFFSENDKSDMSEALRLKLAEYDRTYNFYNSEYEVSLSDDVVIKYNELVSKYKTDENEFSIISKPIIGYASLMKILYDAVDFELYLKSGLMPTIELSSTNASDQIKKLEAFSYTSVSVQDLEKCSLMTVTNSVISMAQVVISSLYKVSAAESSYSNGVWCGKLKVEHLSNEEDVAVSESLTISVNDNYEEFLEQKIKKALNKNTDQSTDIVSIFSLDILEFKKIISQYSLSFLNRFYTSCQACLNILIEQGVMDNNTDSGLLNASVVYENIYVPYFNKLIAISDEIKLREQEIGAVSGLTDSNGDYLIKGIRTVIDEERKKIQEALNIQNFIGTELWLELISYRREDVYKNPNYISDGLNNSEIIQNAEEFLKVAKKEIVKSSMQQHSISSQLKNLLAMKEFSPIVEHFELGNWLRILVDNDIYKLRLIGYEISFDNLDTISVEFSDVMLANNSFKDINKAIDSIKSIASSYDSVKRQAGQGKASRAQMDSWVDDGLSMTQMKIVDNAENQNIEWSENGILGREYIPEYGSYDDKQFRIINRGLYLTDDNWLTTKAAIGNFYYFDPRTGEYVNKYGVIADALVGNFILSKEASIYNSSSSIVLDENGFQLTSDYEEDKKDKTVFLIQKKTGEDQYEKQMHLDDDGNLVLNGALYVATGDGITPLTNIADNAISVNNIAIREDIARESTSITEKYDKNILDVYDVINGYKAEVGQYMQYGDDGLTLGASTSPYKTVVDNNGLYFKNEDAIISYINNRQLYIPNAVIENTLTLGSFFFAPRSDGSFTLTWQNPLSAE